MVRILRKGYKGAEGMGDWGLGLGRGLRSSVPEVGLWTPLGGRTQALGLLAGPCSWQSHSCDFPVCSCALQRDLLLQGRLYISPNWLCFHASLFGKDIKVVISGKASAQGGEAPALWAHLKSDLSLCTLALGEASHCEAFYPASGQ